MSINKNFVVKNGFEVNTDLILANASTKRVGIGSTVPQYTLDVRGGIGVTDIYAVGISTVLTELNVGTGGTALTALGSGLVGVGTISPAYLLDVRSPVSTGQTALYVQGDVRVTGDLSVDDITFDSASLTSLEVTGIATVGTLGVSGLTTTQNLQVTGVSTFVGFSTFNDYVNIQDGLNVSGFSTFAGITTVTGTTLFSKQLNVSGITTASAYYVDGTSVINNSRQLQNIASLDATTTATIEAAIANGPNTFTDLTVSGLSTFVGLATFNSGLQVVSGVTTLGVTTATNLTAQNLNISGVSTLGTVKISSGIITATSGVVTYYGDGQYLDNVIRGVGIGTSTGVVGYGATILNFQGPGISTITVASGIATINITGGGTGSASIGIGTTPGEAFVGVVTAGNLWYNSNLGRMFIYYDDGDSKQWVDASPSNIGIITSLTNVSFAAGSATSPSMYFVGDTQTGFFSPSAGQFTVVSSGSSVLNVNSSGIRVSGVTTLGVTTATNLTLQQLNVSGVTTSNSVIVGSAITITSSGINASAGVITATTFQGNLIGTATNATLAVNAQGLTGTPNVNVGNIVGSAATFTNLTVNGTQTIINTTELNISDKTVGIGSTSTPSDALADGAGIVVYGNTNKTLLYDNTRKGWDFNIPLTTDEVRFYNVAERHTRIDGNTASLVYSANGSNIGLCTNPTGNITLAVTGIPTSSDFDNHTLTFSVFVTQTGTARSCTAVTLNGLSATIRWVGGSLANAVAGVTTTSGMDIYSFTGINTVGSASTTANYYVLGVVNGGYR